VRFAQPRNAWLLVPLAVLVLGESADPARSEPRRKKSPPDPTGLTDSLADPSQDAYRFFQFGNQYFQQGLLRQAQESFERALSSQPAYAEAKYMLAIVAMELNDPARAMRYANEALAENPFFTECHNVLGMVHARLGQYDRALAEFQAVLGDINFPTPEVAHFNIGKVFWEQQACGDAVIHFRRALEVNPQLSRAWHLLGDCQEQLGQVIQAKESYLRAVELGGDADVTPMFRLGYVCFQAGDFACARQWFDKVRTLQPASDMAGAAREYVRQMDFR
jgi:tetratricopeptide (TPR) repeat protein